MDRLLLAAGIVVAAVGVAVVLSRRRPAAQPKPRSWAVPMQLARGDFERSEAPWLVAVFTSATCETCAGVLDRARPLESDAVAVVEVEVGRRGDLHERYGIEAVPLVVVADSQGVVRGHRVGPVTSAELWALVAEARDAD